MSGLTVIDRGTLPDGREYRVVRRWDGWTRCFVGDRHGKGKRRSMKWLREQLEAANALR